MQDLPENNRKKEVDSGPDPDSNKARPNTYKAEKREIFDYPVIQSASPAKNKKLRDESDELTDHLDKGV